MLSDNVVYKLKLFKKCLIFLFENTVSAVSVDVVKMLFFKNSNFKHYVFYDVNTYL